MNILLVYGGDSCEHDISVITACLAKGYFDGNIYSGYFTHDNICYLVPNSLTPKQHKSQYGSNGAKSGKNTEIVFLNGRGQIALVKRKRIVKTVDIDVVVNCCHGRCGEDGAIAGLCEMANLPLVGCDIVAAGITMDKGVTKQLLRSLRIPTVDGLILHNGFNDKDIDKLEKLGYPIIVKPATLGSSIGISLCKTQIQLREGLETAFMYDSKVVCEKALSDFCELNCAAMRTSNGVEVSVVERPYTTHDILTFQDKYQNGSKFTPTQTIDEALSEKVQALTAKLYTQLDLSGVVRIDYLVVDDKLYVNEINSIPGSLAYGLWQHKYTPQQFGALLVENAVKEFEYRKMLNHKYNSGVLDSATITKK